MNHLPAAIEIEQERLASLVSTVWDPGHYSPDCNCDTCTTTREYLSPPDLRFINHVATQTSNGPTEDLPEL